MPTIRPFNRTFLKALQTTRPSDGASDFSGYGIFQNVRTHRDEAEMRPGRAPLQTFALEQTAMSFAQPDRVSANRDPRALDLNVMKRWTLDILLDPLLAADGYVYFALGYLGIESAVGGLAEAIISQTGGQPNIVLTSTSVVGANGRHHVTLERDGADLNLVVDGVVEDSDVIVSEIDVSAISFVEIGPVFDGVMDFVRIREGVYPTNQLYSRLLHPRAKSVRACWRDGPDGDGIVWDHSVFENHGRITGAGVTAGASLAHPHMPVQAMRSFIADENKRKLFVAVGGTEYGGDV